MKERLNKMNSNNFLNKTINFKNMNNFDKKLIKDKCDRNENNKSNKNKFNSSDIKLLLITTHILIIKKIISKKMQMNI